jgi:hypothetical protein
MTLRQSLAARALELAQQAEAIESLPDDAEGLQVRIAQYRYMLDGAESEPKQRVVAELLRDAESKSRQISSDKRLPGLPWPDLHRLRSATYPTRLSASP